MTASNQPKTRTMMMLVAFVVILLLDIVSAAGIRSRQVQKRQEREQFRQQQQKNLQDAIERWDSQLIHSYEYTFYRVDGGNANNSDHVRVQVIQDAVTQVFHVKNQTTDQNAESVLTVSNLFQAIHQALQELDEDSQLVVNYHPKFGYPQQLEQSYPQDTTKNVEIYIQELLFTSQLDIAGNASTNNSTTATSPSEEGQWMSPEEYLMEQAREKWLSRDVSKYSFIYQRNMGSTTTGTSEPLQVLVNNKYVTDVYTTTPGSTPLPTSTKASVGSIEQIFELIWEFTGMQDVYSVYVEYDEEFGFPVFVQIEQKQNNKEALTISIENFQDLTTNATQQQQQQQQQQQPGLSIPSSWNDNSRSATTITGTSTSTL